MITMHEALTANEFHFGDCTRTVGPRGGVKIKSEVWRRNGRTKTWSTRPSEFIIPVKYGLRTCSKIVEYDAANWHTPDQCPLLDAPITLIGAPGHAKAQHETIRRLSPPVQDRSIAMFDRLFTLPK